MGLEYASMPGVQYMEYEGHGENLSQLVLFFALGLIHQC